MIFQHQHVTVNYDEVINIALNIITKLFFDSY